MTLTPAYGRDYKSKKEALKAFNDNKDFEVNDFLFRGGIYTNKADLIKLGYRTVTLRYGKLRKAFTLEIK